MVFFLETLIFIHRLQALLRDIGKLVATTPKLFIKNLIEPKQFSQSDILCLTYPFKNGVQKSVNSQ